MSDHYKQFSIQDPIEARLTYKEGSAQVIDKSTGKDITSEGTLTYKHIDKNSTANHGFNLKIGDPKQLKFFESSIDLLSYAALNRDQLNDTWLVSMEEIENQKAKIHSEQEKMRASKRRLQQLKNQQRIQKEIELDR